MADFIKGAALRFFPYAKHGIRLIVCSPRLFCGTELSCSNCRISDAAHTHNQPPFFRMLRPKQRSLYSEVWHLWTVLIPRRSITGRLLWGTVLRRRDSGRWIYKKYIKSFNATEYRKSAHALIAESRKTASRQSL